MKRFFQIFGLGGPIMLSVWYVDRLWSLIFLFYFFYFSLYPSFAN